MFYLTLKPLSEITMKALNLYGVQDVRLEDVRKPELKMQMMF